MPFKVFVNGNVLTAQEVNDFMMNQQIAVFSTESDRDTAITSPTEGQFAFIKTGDYLTVFNGTLWRRF